jgi:hypothetical protein
VLELDGVSPSSASADTGAVGAEIPATGASELASASLRSARVKRRLTKGWLTMEGSSSPRRPRRAALGGARGRFAKLRASSLRLSERTNQA